MFSSTSIDIICNHIPKILRGCNCFSMLYTCMAWICDYITHKTGKEGVFILRWRPGAHILMKRWHVPDCRKLLWHKCFACFVPYGDDVTVRSWSLPSVSMFRMRLPSKTNIVIRLIGYAYQETISRNKTSKDKVTISPNDPDIWMVVALSIFIVSRWNRNGMYGKQMTMLLWYSSLGFIFCFNDLLTPHLAAIWDFQT